MTSPRGIRGASRTLALAAAIGVASIATGGCGPAPTPIPSAAGSSQGALTSPVEGVPIDIEAEGLTQVTAFTIRTDDGEQLRFVLGPLENATQFPPGHLAEHLAGSTRIKVFFRPEGGDEVAYRLEDAPTP
jgi:hypothetical protein